MRKESRMDLQERLCTYIDDAIASEAAAVTNMKDMASEATTTDDRDLFKHISRVASDHEQRLMARLREMDKEPSNVKGVLGKLSNWGRDVVGTMRDKEERALANIVAAFGATHTAIASYIVLEKLAWAAGDSKTAEMAIELRRDEEEITTRLRHRLDALTLAEGKVRVAA